MRCRSIISQYCTCTQVAGAAISRELVSDFELGLVIVDSGETVYCRLVAKAAVSRQVVSDVKLIIVIVDIGETVYCRLVAEAAISREVVLLKVILN